MYVLQECLGFNTTNLDWINSRDDLRLLRSIKYGVAGTSMTPWGDFTNSLQRLQLVMFIRNLTKEQNRRKKLDNVIYQAFDLALITIDEARIANGKTIEHYKNEKLKLKQMQSDFEFLISQGNEKASQNALENYKDTLKLDQELNFVNKKDLNLLSLKDEVKHLKAIYFNLGISLINKNLNTETLDIFYKIISSNKELYSFDQNGLKIQVLPDQIELIKKLQTELIGQIDEVILNLGKNEKLTNDSLTQLSEIETEKASYEKLKKRIRIDIDESIRSLNKQQTIVDEL